VTKLVQDAMDQIMINVLLVQMGHFY